MLYLIHQVISFELIRHNYYFDWQIVAFKLFCEAQNWQYVFKFFVIDTAKGFNNFDNNN